MPFATVKLKPGVSALTTALQNEVGYQSSQLIRFRAGLAQKISGWSKYISSAALSGIARKLHAWSDLNQTAWLGAGTTQSLSVCQKMGITDISPQTLTTNSGANFTTSIGSASVTVVDASLPGTLSTLDSVTINTPVSVGGLILSGSYAIASVLSPTQFTITAASNATGNVSNGGAVPSFTTTSGLPNVTVTLNGHGLSVGQNIVFPISTSVGGLTISGSYAVASVADANNVVIVCSAQATSSTSASMNAGNAQFIYGILVGTVANSGTPYGYGTYGSDKYGGTGSVTPITGNKLTVSDWTLDNWGQDLIACPSGGSIYYWAPNGSYVNAAPVPGAPQYNSGVFVSARYQILVAYGSTPLANGIGVAQDPLWVRWCDQGNFFTWTPTVSNQAGGQRLYSGSRIVAGYGGPLTDLLWTDIDLWSMNYIGPPFVYGFNKVAANCGIVGAHAFATLAGTVFWMSPSNFFKSDGSSAQILPCSVWDSVFQDLDTTNAWKCFAWSNTPGTEVWFYYPSVSGGIGECDKYAKYNVAENTWDTGTLPRSAAIDQSVLGNPIATTQGGVIYQHETGYNADGAAMSSSFQTGFFRLGEGEDFVFVDRLYPDMTWGTAVGSQTAQVKITIQATNYPGDTPRVYGPFTVTRTTEYVPARIRARYMSFSVASSDVGSFWRLGALKYRYAPDGRR